MQYFFDIVIMKTSYVYLIMFLLTITVKISWTKYILIEIREDVTGKFDNRDLCYLIGTQHYLNTQFILFSDE